MCPGIASSLSIKNGTTAHFYDTTPRANQYIGGADELMGSLLSPLPSNVNSIPPKNP